MFQSSTSDTINKLYTLYQEHQHPHYFRHFPPNLSYNLFHALFQLSLPFDIIENNEVAGVLTVSLNQLTKNVDLGIIIFDPYQHQGLCFKAMKKQADILFKHHAHKLCSTCSSSDERAIHLLEKSGFIKEATLRDFAFYNNRYHDDLRYALPYKRFKRLYQ